jgi:hypothetical protein
MDFWFFRNFELLGVLFLLLAAIVNIAFAIGVLKDNELSPRANGQYTFFVSIWTWALATLLGGVFVAAIYWAIHHSTLNPNTLSARKDGES